MPRWPAGSTLNPYKVPEPYGGFENLEAFRTAWADCPMYVLPVDTRVLTTVTTTQQTDLAALSSLCRANGFHSAKAFLLQYAKGSLVEKTTPVKAVAEGGYRRNDRALPMLDWQHIVFIASVLDIPPENLVDDFEYYRSYTHVQVQLGFRRYKLWMECWRQGVSPADVLDYALENNAIFEFREFTLSGSKRSFKDDKSMRFYKNIFALKGIPEPDIDILPASVRKNYYMPRKQQPDIPDRLLLFMCTMLKISPRDMFIDLRKYDSNRSPLWLVIDLLPSLSFMDLLTMYALIELMASDYGTPESLVSGVLTILTEKRPQWEALYSAGTD